MKGRIIGFDPTTYKGAINGQDGQRYDFVMQDWRGTAPPKVGAEVDFVTDGTHAREIYLVAGVAASMSFGDAVGACFRRYVTFSGRARRKEYWYWALFAFIVYVVAAILDNALGIAFTETISGETTSMGYGPIYTIVALVFFLPSLSVLVRRLHDHNRSGWWFWIALIPLVGGIILLVWMCQKGTSGENRYGSDPLMAA